MILLLLCWMLGYKGQYVIEICFKTLVLECLDVIWVVVIVVVVAIINNQNSRLILVNMEVLHWRVWVVVSLSCYNAIINIQQVPFYFKILYKYFIISSNHYDHMIKPCVLYLRTPLYKLYIKLMCIFKYV